MKALVLAGGKGTRLRPFTYSMPKQLVPVANRSVLEHVLIAIAEMGVTEIGMIVGDQAERVRAVVGDGSALGLHVTFIPQDAPRGLAHCVRIAADFLGDDDFVMYLGDNILIGGLAQAADEFREHRPAARILVTKVADPSQFGIAELDATGQVTQLVEKPPRPRSNMAVIGVYFFTSQIHKAVWAIRPSARGELEITDAIQHLVASGATVMADEYTGFWKDTGTVDDVLECNRVLLGRQAPAVAGSVDAASRLVGAVTIDEGARVRRSRIVGPAIIGPGTLIEDCDLGPHVSIGGDCTLRHATISDSIVFSEVSVEHVGAIRGSLIGRSAQVRAAAPADSHRLVIGDNSRIEVPA
jgi:glucose-1-phosphate thymidylyltransferase